jgi:hypothetical protein
VTARRAIVASMAVASLALAALGDWNIGVVGNRIKVEGNAIRPWNPRSLGAKLACWFDADDNSTLLDAGGDPADDAEAVQTWQDKSGYGRHATAPAEAQRPTRQVNVQNGRSVVRTDGGDQLNIASAAGVFKNKTAGYIFAVIKDADQAGGTAYHGFVMWDRNTAKVARLWCYGRHTSFAGAGWVAVGRRLDADAAAGIAFGAVGNHALVRVFADWSGGKLKIAVNQGSEASVSYASGAGSSSDTDSGAAARIFDATHTPPANSEIAEIIVVNAAMSEAEVAATETYLQTKWGTP